MAETGLAEEISKKNRLDRKEEGKRLKRQRILEAGGVRPRTDGESPNDGSSPSHREKGKKPNNKQKSKKKKQSQPPQQQQRQQYRFGRVMETVPTRNKPRFSTLSIAVPGSVLSNCQTRELKTHLVGQIARACTIYHVDEVVVFDDKLSKDNKGSSRFHHHSNGHRGHNDSTPGGDTADNEKNDHHDNANEDPSVDRSCAFLARVLQYCECPQYLRRHFFPRHPDLNFAGLLPPIDAPHHVRMDDRSKYREGAVIEDRSGGKEESSLVNCGIRNRPIEVDRKLPIGIRCTVQLDVREYGRPGKRMSGKVVSPSTPREDDGTYWGYQTRMAESLHKVFEECPFDGGYDVKIGTSERGDVSIDDKGISVPQFRHSLIVFGGVAGIEECVDADESHTLPGSQSKKLFDIWVNVCPFQGSRTIRTEEAVLITLARFSPLLAENVEIGEAKSMENEKGKTQNETPAVDFSDGVSEESSDGDSD